MINENPLNEVNPFLYSFQSANLGKLKGLKFSTNVLCHVTHNEHAAEIRPNRLDRYHYTFKPKQELGKEYIYDGRPLGETYLNTVPFYNMKEFPEVVGVPITPDQMKYQKIPGTDPVLPGYYSWWGISLEDQLPQQAIDAVRELEQRGTYVAGYVKSGPAPPVRPVRPWPYQFLRRKNGVAGILTYERVASYIQSFLLEVSAG